METKRQIHHAGMFYVVQEILTDGSEVFDVKAWGDGDPEPMLMFAALDEKQAIRVCDGLHAVVAAEGR